MVRLSRWPRWSVSGAASVFAATAAAGGLAVAFGAISARQFGLRYEELSLLPQGSRPIRILHVSDMHLVAGDQKKIDFVRELAALEPDLIVNTGDNPGGVTAVDDVLEALEPLLQTPGIFVLGSNDFYGPHAVNPLRYLVASTARNHDDGDHHLDRIDVSRLHDGLTQSGQWHPVGNRRLTLRVNGVTLNIAGTHDAHMQADRWPGYPQADPAAIRLALTHAPYRRVLDAAVADGAQLILAGHTHGGQVALPHYGAIVSNCDVPTGRAAGLFTWQSAGRQAHVNVSAGIGASPMVPLRTFCRPEAVVVDLLPADDTTPYD